MNLLLPDSDALVPRVVARNGRRARQALVGLRRLARVPERRQACAAFETTLASLRGQRRREFLWSPDLRAWLAAAEEAMALARPQETDAALFERIARGPHLAVVLPEGCIDRTFRRRVRGLGERLLEKVFRRIPPLLFLLTPAGRRFGPFSLDLEPDAEEARVAGELHTAFPVPTTWRLEAGSQLEFDGEEAHLHVEADRLPCRARPLIHGSSIVLARRAVARRNGLAPGPASREFPGRLGAALSLIGEAWEEARREIEIHTRVVVPLEQSGVVSYSLPDRPGTSYINMRGKRLVDLADDLLHETAHHRLHSLEEISALERQGTDAQYYSPWRNQVRPLHGILHAAYTFTFRAELFQRLLRLRGRLPRVWLRGEIDREREMLHQSVRDLRDAEEQQFLTAAGSRLLDDLAAHIRALRRG